MINGENGGRGGNYLGEGEEGAFSPNRKRFTGCVKRRDMRRMKSTIVHVPDRCLIQ